MTNEPIPKGELFTHVYLERENPVPDSPKFRKRIGSFCDSEFDDFNYKLGRFLEQELGLDIPSSGVWEFEEFFKEIKTKYLLNAITLVWRFAKNIHSRKLQSNWHEFVQRAIKEENLGYYLDEKCGVHYLVDKEFEVNRISTLQSLDDQKYSGVRKEFEHAFEELDSATPQTADAIWAMFKSLEILVKQMTKADRLNKMVIQNQLKQIALKIYKDDPTAEKTVENIFQGMGDWVNAIHMYRHGQNVPKPVDPPIELAIYILSSGASFLRFLISINKSRENTS